MSFAGWRPATIWQGAAAAGGFGMRCSNRQVAGTKIECLRFKQLMI